MMMKRTSSEESLISKGRLRYAGGLPEWWASMSQAGLSSFEERGLPHRRIEDWKYTDLRARLKDEFALADPPSGLSVQASKGLFDGMDAYRLCFVNGFYNPSSPMIEGLPEGVRVLALSQALVEIPEILEQHIGKLATCEKTVIADLNSALMSDGAVVIISAGTKVEKPIHVDFRATQTGAFAQVMRNLIVMEEGVSATVIETFSGTDELYLTNCISEVVLSEGAELNHIKTQFEGAKAVHTQNASVEVGKDAHYRNGSLVLGGELSRNEIFVRFVGEGANATLCGAFLTVDGQHLDTTTRVEHAVPNCACDEVYRGVLDGKSRGVFQGKIGVEPDAQKTDSRMMIKSLLLSDRAEMDSKPELEIYADDVKCAHGATVGSLDEQALFYLRSRGIDERTARSLLIGAFVQEALDPIVDGDIRAALEGAVAEMMSRGGAA